MNNITLAIMTQTKPLEPLLEHEIRLRAYDSYEHAAGLPATHWRTGSGQKPRSWDRFSH